MSVVDETRNTSGARAKANKQVSEQATANNLHPVREPGIRPIVLFTNLNHDAN